MNPTNITDNNNINPITYTIPENLQEKYLSNKKHLDNARKAVDIWNIKKAIIDRLSDVSEEVICEGFKIISPTGKWRWDIFPVLNEPDTVPAFIINEVHGDGLTVIQSSPSCKREEIIKDLIEEMAREIATSIYTTVLPLDCYFRIVFNRHDQAPAIIFTPV